jgi:hypothetical protein
MQNVVSVTISTTSGQNGVDTLGASQMSFVNLEAGGTLVLNGGHTTVTGTGDLSVVEEATGQGYNTFDLGAAVTSFSGVNIQAGDIFNLSGFTVADIAAGFAHVHTNGLRETLTISHAGGGSIAFGFLGEHGTLPTISQFHAA